MARLAIAGISTLLLGACSLFPGRFAGPDIKTIALVENPELTQLENHPRIADAHKSVLPLLVHALIFGPEHEKVETGDELYKVLQPLQLRLNARLLDQVEVDLVGQGYKVIRMSPETLRSAREASATTPVAFDIVLDATVVRAGYGAPGDTYTSPFVYVAQSVIDASGRRLTDRLICSGQSGSDITSADITIGSSTFAYEFEDEEEVLAEPQRALKGLQAGVGELAKLISRDFRPRTGT